MPAAHPKEFRDDVVAVARRGEAPIAQLAKDFGISESCLRNWLHQADVEDGHRPGVTKAENEELREARKKIRLLEQAPVLSRRVCAPGPAGGADRGAERARARSDPRRGASRGRHEPGNAQPGSSHRGPGPRAPDELTGAPGRGV